MAKAGEKFNKIVLECSVERDKFLVEYPIDFKGFPKLCRVKHFVFVCFVFNFRTYLRLLPSKLRNSVFRYFNKEGFVNMNYK